MSANPSRRQFLQAGMALPAAGLVSSNSLESAFQEPPKAKEPPKVAYRTLGKTDLKPSGVGYGIGYVPYTDVVARALDMGINYFDTARDYKDSERIFSGVIKGQTARQDHHRHQISLVQKRTDIEGPGHKPEGTGHRLYRHLASARQGHAGIDSGWSARSHADCQEIGQGALPRFQLPQAVRDGRFHHKDQGVRRHADDLQLPDRRTPQERCGGQASRSGHRRHSDEGCGSGKRPESGQLWRQTQDDRRGAARRHQVGPDKSRDRNDRSAHDRQFPNSK